MQSYMKNLLLPLFFAATNLTAIASSTPPPAKPPAEQQPVYVYINPEQIPEHTWDTDLFGRNKQGFSGHAEFLYWKAMEGAMSYAFKTDSVDPVKDTAAIGQYENATYGMDPGFRLALSFFRAPHYWEVWAQYTRMTSHGSNHIAAPSGGNRYLDPVWESAPPASTNQALSAADSSLHLNYNVIDFNFDRVYQHNPHLRLRFIGGLTGAWIDQSTQIDYSCLSGDNSSVHLKWNYWGAGFRFGFMGDWYWFEDFYMTSRFTLAGFVGPYENSSHQTSDGTVTRNTRYSDNRAVVNMQLLIGPSWQKTFGKRRIELFAGCEYNIWGNLQEVYNTSQASPTSSRGSWINKGDLSFIGLTARATTTF